MVPNWERSTSRLYVLTLLVQLTCIMLNAGLDKAQAGIKIAGRNIKNLIYTDDTTLMAESEEELKGLLMKVKEESEKVGLKLKKKENPQSSWHPVPSLHDKWMGKQWKE